MLVFTAFNPFAHVLGSSFPHEQSRQLHGCKAGFAPMLALQVNAKLNIWGKLFDLFGRNTAAWIVLFFYVFVVDEDVDDVVEVSSNRQGRAEGCGATASTSQLPFWSLRWCCPLWGFGQRSQAFTEWQDCMVQVQNVHEVYPYRRIWPSAEFQHSNAIARMIYSTLTRIRYVFITVFFQKNMIYHIYTRFLHTEDSKMAHSGYCRSHFACLILLRLLRYHGFAKLQKQNINMGVEPKIGFFSPKMDGENNGKPYEQMDDLGGVFPLFLETQYEQIHTLNCLLCLQLQFVEFNIFVAWLVASHQGCYPDISTQMSRQE